MPGKGARRCSRRRKSRAPPRRARPNRPGRAKTLACEETHEAAALGQVEDIGPVDEGGHHEDGRTLAAGAIVKQAGRAFLPENRNRAGMAPVGMAPVAGETIQEQGQARRGLGGDGGSEFLRLCFCQLGGEAGRPFPQLPLPSERAASQQWQGGERARPGERRRRQMERQRTRSLAPGFLSQRCRVGCHGRTQPALWRATGRSAGPARHPPPGPSPGPARGPGSGGQARPGPAAGAWPDYSQSGSGPPQDFRRGAAVPGEVLPASPPELLCCAAFRDPRLR